MKIGSKLSALAFTLRVPLKGVPDFGRWEKERGQPMLTDALLAQESPTWRPSAGREQLLIQPSNERVEPAAAALALR